MIIPRKGGARCPPNEKVVQESRMKRSLVLTVSFCSNSGSTKKFCVKLSCLSRFWEGLTGKAVFFHHMSIELIDYIPCWRCNYQYIGRTVKEEFWFAHNGLAVFEVYTVIICLRCGTVQ